MTIGKKHSFSINFIEVGLHYASVLLCLIYFPLQPWKILVMAPIVLKSVLLIIYFRQITWYVNVYGLMDLKYILNMGEIICTPGIKDIVKWNNEFLATRNNSFNVCIFFQKLVKAIDIPILKYF